MTQQATEPQASRMLRVSEVCDQLGIGRTKFYVLINKGELEAVSMNPGGKRRALRVEQSVVDAYKARNKVTVP